MSAPQPDIFAGVIDHLEPEAQAMIIAKYSRSYESVRGWIPTSQGETESLKKRMGVTFLGYGHKSVGQLGHTTIFFEGVSQLAAKAIEDDQLFNGQESSTRYIDYSTQPMVCIDFHPEYDALIREYQEKFRALYIKALPLVRERLGKEYPFQMSTEKPIAIGEQSASAIAEKVAKDRKVWENTIKARTFDICRGLLPAGSVTNVAFTGTFDLINDHFGKMLFHPSSEMRMIADRALASVRSMYGHAINDNDALKERFSYVADNPKSWFYPRIQDQPNFRVVMDVEGEALRDAPLARSILQREKWDMVPRDVSENFRFRLGGKMDFGAFRDLHRHRNGIVLMPLLTPELGFHPWYLKEWPVEVAAEAVALLSSLENLIPAIFNMEVQLQYAVPMGARVRVQYDCGLNQAAYLLELRSGKTVHQTLRQWTHDVYADMSSYNRYGQLAAKIYPDLDKDNFTLKRGTQTFAEVK